MRQKDLISNKKCKLRKLKKYITFANVQHSMRNKSVKWTVDQPRGLVVRASGY